MDDNNRQRELTTTMDQFQFIADELKEVKAEICKLRESINGNGSRGLKTEVSLNTDFRCRYQPMLDKLMLKLITAFVIVGGVLVGAVYAIVKQ
jgi:hypothetical protein